MLDNIGVVKYDDVALNESEAKVLEMHSNFAIHNNVNYLRKKIEVEKTWKILRRNGKVQPKPSRTMNVLRLLTLTLPENKAEEDSAFDWLSSNPLSSDKLIYSQTSTFTIQEVG